MDDKAAPLVTSEISRGAAPWIRYPTTIIMQGIAVLDSYASFTEMWVSAQRSSCLHTHDSEVGASRKS